MNVFKRLWGYPRPHTSPEDRIDEFAKDEKYERITKRELLQSHRAQPQLVESLLHAHEAQPVTEARNRLTMENVLSLVQFSKQMKWLCAWGMEIVDEALRPPCADQPLVIKLRSPWKHPQSKHRLSEAEFMHLLKDTTQHWDRIILPHYDPEHFALLHMHPCQELYLDFELYALSLIDMENIAKCTNLRVLNIHMIDDCTGVIHTLQHLPNLQQLIYDAVSDTFPYMRALKHLPYLSTIQINNALNDDYDYVAYPFTDYEMQEAFMYIGDRRQTTRQLYLTTTLGSIVFGALGMCTRVESISVEDFEGWEENDMAVLFGQPNLQKKVRHIRLRFAIIDAEAVASLAKFTNLRWLDCSAMDIDTDEIAPVILANAHHLHTLTISECPFVTDALLEAIAQCKSLQIAFVKDTGLTLEAVEQYREAKRPNWQVIVLKNRR